MSVEKIRLTQTVKKGGCAAKLPASLLRSILSKVKFPEAPPFVLHGNEGFDDAALIDVKGSDTIINTIDFFTPIVDDPYTFGAVAAANALSDVYAMGGRPISCMAVLAFPMTTMDEAVVVEILQGATDKIAESGAALVGGHSIDDETLKFGLSVTGVLENGGAWKNASAKIGDKLILTKPLGTGTLLARAKAGEASEKETSEVIESMTKLNRLPKGLAGINAATDVTGFGLAGHLVQMCEASGVSARLNFKRIPSFPTILESLGKEHLTRAHRTNRNYTEGKIIFNEQSPLEELVLFDPQTSGGLLLAVDPQHAADTLSAIRNDFPYAYEIGEINSSHDSQCKVEVI